MWAQYRCPSWPEHKGYMLNVARAERCLNAWADVPGDCTDDSMDMTWSSFSDTLKPMKMLQWNGDYDDPQEFESMRPCGLMQHFWTASGSCDGNPYRYASVIQYTD